MAVTRFAPLCGVLVLAAWFGGSFPTEGGSSLAPTPLKVLVREAQVVAVVKVLKVQDVPGTSLATATLQIQEVLKPAPGFTGEFIKVRFQSLTVPSGTSRPLVAGGPSYSPGERAVVFLKPSHDGSHFETVRGPLGKRTIRQGRVALEDVGLEAFLAQIRAALSAVEPRR